MVQKYRGTVADNHGGTAVQVVTVTLTGTNDPTVILAAATTASGSITELAGVTGSTATDLASGTISFKDADFIDTHTATVVAQGTGYVGNLTLGPVSDSTNGATGSVGWTFSVVDGAIDFLAAGQTLVQKYNVTVADNHGGTAVQVVTVTLTGPNEVPVISSTVAAAPGSVTELAGVTGSTAADLAAGTLTFTDVDLTDTHTATAAAQGTGYLGSFTLGTLADSTNGVTGSVSWTFSVVDGALDFLAAGQTLVQKYNVTIDDGHGGAAVQVVTVTLTGTNDVPVVQAIVADVNEHGPAVILTASFTDPDLIDTHTFGISTVGTRGLVTDNGNGTFSYDPNGQFAPLTVGQTATDRFTYDVDDGHGGIATQTATGRIHGQKEDPVITSPAAHATASILEQAGVTGSTALDLETGTITFTDAEAADTHTVTAVAQGAGYVGSFTLGPVTDSTVRTTASVAWNFSVVDGALDFLAAGQTKIDRKS